MAEKGILFVIAAPSGTGKTTLVKALTDIVDGIQVSISHTTRPKRPGETDGVNYHFIDKETFKGMLADGDFLEHATVFENLYGTSKSWVESTLAKGTDVILEIDWQGHRQIETLFPESISIFILPPSLQTLKERLLGRKQDDVSIIEKRLADVRETISHINEFEYVVVNDDFDHAVDMLQTIVQASRLTSNYQAPRLGKLIDDLSNI